MNFTNVKRLASFSLIAAGLASSSIASALEFKCGEASSEFVKKEKTKFLKKKHGKLEEDKEKLYFFTTTTKGNLDKKDVAIKDMADKFVAGVEREKELFKHVKVNKTATYKNKSAVHLEVVHDRENKHGDLEIKADIYLITEGNSFEVVYDSQYVDGDGDSGLTKIVNDNVKITTTQASFERKVGVKRHPLAGKKMFTEKALESLPGDIDSLVELCETVLN